MVNEQVNTFYWVVTLGSFKKTAEKLNTTQPAISARIAKLEQTIGKKLILRNTGSLALTPDGQIFLSYAESVLAMTEVVKSKIVDNTAVVSTIRIGVVDTVVVSWYCEFIERVNETYPNVNLEMCVDNTVDLRDQLFKRSLDFAILMGPISDYRFSNITLKPFQMAFLANNQLVTTLQGMDLVQCAGRVPLLTFPQASQPFSELKSYLNKSGCLEYRLFPSNSLPATLKLVQNGVGIGCMPLDIAHQEIQQGTVNPMELGWVPNPIQLTASYAVEPSNAVINALGEIAKDVSFKYHNDTFAIS